MREVALSCLLNRRLQHSLLPFNRKLPVRPSLAQANETRRQEESHRDGDVAVYKYEKQPDRPARGLWGTRSLRVLPEWRR